MDVVKAGAPQIPVQLFTAIALFAVANTALVNFMMASRILYGMAKDNLMPREFGNVHPKFRTPHIATAAVFIIVVVLTLTGNLMRLAQSTAVLLLSSFFIVNLSLLRIKLKKSPGVPPFRAPLWAPVLGALTCFGLLFYASIPALLTALTLLGISFVLFFFNRLTPR
jgi:amino acid transporter